MDVLRALLVSYAFPPVGGAGVQRVVKLAKYLPEHGVEPSVLCVDNPSVPLRDESLLRDVAPGLRVIRAPTLEPGYAVKRRASSASSKRSRLVALAKLALFPDPQVLWQPAAQLALSKRLLDPRPDHLVFVSGPPFSQFLLGPLARLCPGTAVVFDYRDEWSTLRQSYENSSRATAALAARLERALLRSAHAVTTATEAFRAELLRRFDFLDPARVHAIPNGYDPEDFRDALPALPSDRFVLTYAGTVFRLTRAQGLLGALRLLHEREPALAPLLEVRFLGRIVESEQYYFEDSERLGVHRLGYVEHTRMLSALGESHATLCLLDDLPENARIYPAKIFELMRLGRPCLTLAPEGALTELVHRHRFGLVAAPRDVEAIAAALARLLRAFARGEAIGPPAIGVDRYDRRRQAGQFAAVFRDAVARAHPEPRRFFNVSTLRPPTTSARR